MLCCVSRTQESERVRRDEEESEKEESEKRGFNEKEQSTIETAMRMQLAMSSGLAAQDQHTCSLPSGQGGHHAESFMAACQ